MEGKRFHERLGPIRYLSNMTLAFPEVSSRLSNFRAGRIARAPVLVPIPAISQEVSAVPSVSKVLSRSPTPHRTTLNTRISRRQTSSPPNPHQGVCLQSRRDYFALPASVVYIRTRWRPLTLYPFGILSGKSGPVRGSAVTQSIEPRNAALRGPPMHESTIPKKLGC